jgi:hypothetical protein
VDARDTNPKVLRPSKAVAIVLFIIGGALAAVGGWQVRKSGSFSIAHAIMILGALSIAGAIQSLMARIVLLPDRIEFGGPFGRTSIAKDEIESVSWAAGCGVSLRMKTQSWRRIPDLGRAQGVCNSVRAWLKR